MSSAPASPHLAGTRRETMLQRAEKIRKLKTDPESPIS
jgi:hypothetical protein